jgi:cytochrome P450
MRSDVAGESLLCPEAVREPERFFARLRAEQPVAWNEAHRAWVVTRHADIVAASRSPHLCLGAPLARLEVACAVGRLLDRFPEPALADEPLGWHPTVLSRALVHLPVRLA